MNGRKRTYTRQLEEVLTGLEEDFKAFYCKDDFDRLLAKMEKQKRMSTYPFCQKELYRMLDACKVKDGGKEYKRGGSEAYYRDLIKKADIPESLEDLMLYALYTRYKKYPAPEKYIERLVNTLSFPEDGWEKEPLRLRLLKQFIKYGSDPDDKNWTDNFTLWGYQCGVITAYCKSKDGKCRGKDKTEILRLLDDGVFEELDRRKQAGETFSKDDRRKYALLNAMENLAQGGFQTGGATRGILYLFAMVYDMTYYSGAEDERFDYERDLEKNLFGDYYCNNVMRFLYNREYRKGGLENDPSERGINYKNFAEMICLYYISVEDEDLEPWKRVKLAGEMIERVKSAAKEERAKREPEKSQEPGTAYYRNRFVENALSKPEAEFEAFLLDNYNCDSAGKGVFQLETDQNTAFEVYRSLVDELEGSCNYGLWFTDVAGERKEGLKAFPQRWTKEKIDEKKYGELLEVLTAVNNLMGHTPKEKTGKGSKNRERKQPSQTRAKALRVSSPADMSRTSFLVAYYYWYNENHESGGERTQRSFQDVFNEFKDWADEELQYAGYTPLSGKNLFDVLLAFSIYARGLI